MINDLEGVLRVQTTEGLIKYLNVQRVLAITKKTVQKPGRKIKW